MLRSIGKQSVESVESVNISKWFDRRVIDQVNAVVNVWALPARDRWRMYRYWLSLYRAHLRDNIRDLERHFQMAANRMKELLDEEDLAIMRTMKIIGMTTTGAAR